MDLCHLSGQGVLRGNMGLEMGKAHDMVRERYLECIEKSDSDDRFCSLVHDPLDAWSSRPGDT